MHSARVVGRRRTTSMAKEIEVNQKDMKYLCAKERPERKHVKPLLCERQEVGKEKMIEQLKREAKPKLRER